VTQAHAFVWLRGGRFPSQHLRWVFLQHLRGEALDTNFRSAQWKYGQCPNTSRD